MFMPNTDDNGFLGVQKHQVSGLLYIGNFPAAEKEIANALNNDTTPAIAIVCCTTTYGRDKYNDLREKVAHAKTQRKLLHLDIGFGDLPPEDRERIPDNDLNNIFSEAYTFIDNAIQNNIPVLVHCDAGSSRSASLIVAYLMRAGNIALHEAEKRVVMARGTVLTVDFQTQQQIKANVANIDNFRQFLTDCEREFHALKPPVAQPSQLPINLALGVEPIALSSDENNPKNVATPKLLENVFRLESKLDEIVTTMANQYSNKDRAYTEINNLFSNQFASGAGLSIDKDINTHLETLLEMSQLFQTLIAHKNKIDIHKNIKLDRFVLFKDNTSSWQSLLKNIRTTASAELESAVRSMRQKNTPPDVIIKFLETQRNNPIFCLHRGNHWYEKLGVTDSVKKINSMIAEQEAILPRNEQILQN